MDKIKLFNLSKPVLVLVIFTIALLLFLVDWGFFNNSYTVYNIYDGSEHYFQAPNFLTYFVDGNKKTVRAGLVETIVYPNCEISDRKNWSCLINNGQIEKIYLSEGNLHYSYKKRGIIVYAPSPYPVVNPLQVSKINWIFNLLTTPFRYLIYLLGS